MIRDFEFYHGLVFARILHGTQQSLCLRPYHSISNASYVVNDTIGIYIKHSSKRLTPWRFTFAKHHQKEIDHLQDVFKSVFLILVCSDDGVACLSYNELNLILSCQNDTIEWISVSRHKREMYSIKGSNGSLDFKIGKGDFPKKLFSAKS